MSEKLTAHPECQQAVSSLHLDQKLLEKDVHQLSIMGEKLAEAVNKIQEMNTNLCALIKIQAEKHEHHSKADEALDADLIDIAEKLEPLRTNASAPKVETAEEKEVRDSLNDLQRWKWMIIGGALALGFVFGGVTFDTLAKFFH